MSSSAPSSLPRLLLGSLIGAVIGLILLALGMAILWKAADPRGSTPEGVAAFAPAPPLSRNAEATSPVPYPAVGPGKPPPVQIPVETPPRAATSLWRSIFDDGDDRLVAEAEAAPSRAAPAPPTRPAPRPAAPRRPPEAQRQDDSLFF
ncbi:hypothetical protein [Brevundimonas sp.]|uniref:hypothetical protein n=1 Tax=Brevundimonas sp. TaxID=1871086 RepID=UPI002ED780E0